MAINRFYRMYAASILSAKRQWVVFDRSISDEKGEIAVCVVRNVYYADKICFALNYIDTMEKQLSSSMRLAENKMSDYRKLLMSSEYGKALSGAAAQKTRVDIFDVLTRNYPTCYVGKTVEFIVRDLQTSPQFCLLTIAELTEHVLAWKYGTTIERL